MHHDSILIIGGTSRPGSNALRVARHVEQLYKGEKLPAEFYSLEELPMEVFRPEAFAQPPASFVPVQQRVLDAAGLHVVLPEYNGSFPGVLKHFIDLLKFPESFDRKPVAFVGVASGAWGALRAVEQMQMVFGYRNAHSYPDRVFISGIHKRFNPEGALEDPAIEDRLLKQVRGFAQFCGLFARPRP